MLVIEEDDGTALCIGQASHAWVSGQIAARWRADAVGEALLLAAGQHDVGMAEWDRAPRLDASTGRPVGFMAMERPEHIALWSQAPSRLMTQSLHAALLVSMHGTALYERSDLSAHPHAGLIRGYLDEQHALQERWRSELRLDPAEVRREQRLLFCWDALSLALCLGWDAMDLPPVGEDERRISFEPVGDARGHGRLTPWPFGAEDAVELVCEGRRLRERCASEHDLRAALEAAPVELQRFTLAR